MASPLLDFKKFKHVKTDEHTTVLQHKDGHQLTIHHKSLSKENQAQLRALASLPHNDTSEKSPDMHSKANSEHKSKEPVKMASGGPVDDVIEQANPAQMMSIDPNAPIPTPVEQAPQVDPVLQQKREIYNKFEKGMLTDDVARMEGRTFGPNGEEPKNFNPDVWNKAEQAHQAEVANQVQQRQNELKAIVEQNKARAAAGLSPIPIPDSDIPQDQPAQGLAPAPSQQPMAEAQPAPSAQQPTDISEGLMGRGFAREQAGIMAKAKVLDEHAAQQAKVLEEQAKAQATAVDQYKKDYVELEKERKALMQDIKDGQVNPEKYWENHSKLAAGIGMIIAGFNPTSNPNAAVNFLNHQMEQNIKAQAANLGSKENLLSANLRQFGNMKDAVDMTRVMQADYTKNLLEQAAAKAQGPMAKAAAMSALGALDKEYGPLFQQVAARRALQQLSSGMTSPAAIEHGIAMLKNIDPKAAKEYEERYIPGVGIASTNKDAQDLKEMRGGILEAKSGLNELLKMSKKPLKSFNLADRAKAETLQQTLVGALRLPITGPGAMNEGERKMLENLIANPTAIFSLDNNNKVKLQTLMDTMDAKFAAAAKARGVNVPGADRAYKPNEKRVNGVLYRIDPKTGVPTQVSE